MPMTYDDLKFGVPQKPRSGVYKVCENCGKTMYFPKSMAKDHGRFCSRACQKEFYGVKKVCPVCGKEFTVPRGNAHRYTVCSWECRTASGIFVKCERCGKIFRTSEKRYSRHYCSEECRRPPRILICANCGKEFRALPGEEGRKFCSFACYRRFTGETSIEAKIRQTLEGFGVLFQQEVKIGRYSVDFFFPAHFVALEVDGNYWHQDKEKDARKTKYIESKGINVVRITEDEIESCDLHKLVKSKLKHLISLR